MTLYLKYRPQRISELDLTNVREALGKYLESKNIPHAWLFSGPRGTGKTSAARIVAKSVNCKGTGYEPCNECEMCKAITGGSAVDVVEMDAASNRGIDEIRELRDKIRLAPMRAKYKVYIIDEVHMLTTEAANALLKTLEEPPENTMFILCTTDPGKLPETVVSRCTRIIFEKPKQEEILRKLEIVAKGEGLKVDPGDLEAIARESRGSFRDAIKLLEQAAMSGGSISNAIAVTATVQGGDLVDMVNRGQLAPALELIAQMDRQGENWRRVVEVMVEKLRQSLLQKSGKEDLSAEITRIRQLEQVYEQMKTSAVPQLPLEIWVIQTTEKNTNSLPDRPAGETQSPKQVPSLNRNSPSVSASSTKEGEEEVRTVQTKSSGRGKYKLEDLTGKWTEVMKAVRPMNHSVEALLRSTRPMTFDGERLELEVFYKFHKDKLETEKCRSIVEGAVGQVLGETGIKLYLKLGQKSKQEIKEEVTAEGVDDGVIAAAEEIFGAQAI